MPTDRVINEGALRNRAWRHVSLRLAVECGISFEALKGFVGDKVKLSSEQLVRLEKRVRVLETRGLAETGYD